MGRIVRRFEWKPRRACVWASRAMILCLLSGVLNAQIPVPAPETERPVLDNQEKIKLFAGQKVKITGTLEPKSKTIYIVGIEPAQ